MTDTTATIFTNTTSRQTCGRRSAATACGPKADIEHQPPFWKTRCIFSVDMMAHVNWTISTISTSRPKPGRWLTYQACSSHHLATHTCFSLTAVRFTCLAAAREIHAVTSINTKLTKNFGAPCKPRIQQVSKMSPRTRVPQPINNINLALSRRRLAASVTLVKSSRTACTSSEATMEFSVSTTFITSFFPSNVILNFQSLLWRPIWRVGSPIRRTLTSHLSLIAQRTVRCQPTSFS